MNLEDWRQVYDKYSLREEDVPLSPYELFKSWFQKASEDNNPEPNAMTISTFSDSYPESRMVLLKEFNGNQFVFYTNYNSQKGKNIDANPNVSLLFFWPYSQRQIRIKGIASKTPRDKAIEYFNTRPIESRISAISSPQSSRISRTDLVEKTIQIANSNELNCPEHWGGYGVEAMEIEFWQGQPGRLHDRIVYKKTNDNQWEIYRLAP